jgi:plasmid stability protein
MTITIDIRPEVQAELARQAAAHGRAVEAYVASLLEAAVGPDRLSAEHMSVDRLESTFREIAEFSYKIPSVPDEAFARESLYQDHD